MSRVESVHEGEGLSHDDDPRTEDGTPAETDKGIIAPKNSERIDPFPSSEVAERIGPYNKTTG